MAVTANWSATVTFKTRRQVKRDWEVADKWRKNGRAWLTPACNMWVYSTTFANASSRQKNFRQRIERQAIRDNEVELGISELLDLEGRFDRRAEPLD